MGEITVNQVPIHIGQGQVTFQSRCPQHAAVEEMAQSTCAVASYGADRDGVVLADEEALNLALAGVGDGVDASVVPTGKVEIPTV
ncbi:hypothetical protein D9M69_406420 [compost metagenome]